MYAYDLELQYLAYNGDWGNELSDGRRRVDEEGSNTQELPRAVSGGTVVSM